MNDKEYYAQGEAMFYKKVFSHLKQIKMTVSENEKRKKQASRDWFYGKKEKGSE